MERVVTRQEANILALDEVVGTDWTREVVWMVWLRWLRGGRSRPGSLFLVADVVRAVWGGGGAWLGRMLDTLVVVHVHFNIALGHVWLLVVVRIAEPYDW